MSSDTPAGKDYVEFAEKLFLELTGVLGLLYQEQEEEIPQEVLELVSRVLRRERTRTFNRGRAARSNSSVGL